MKPIISHFSQKYNKGIIIIHWISALLIFLLYPLGKYMSGLEVSEKLNLIKIHAILGFLLFILTIIRSVLFFKYSRPNRIRTGSKWNDNLAISIQRGLYFLLILVSILGIFSMIQGGYGIAIANNSPSAILVDEEIVAIKAHGIIATIIIILSLLHIAGVFRYMINKYENIIKRMS